MSTRRLCIPEMNKEFFLQAVEQTLIDNIDKVSNGGYNNLVKFSELTDLIRGYEDVRLATVDTYYKEANNLFQSE